MSAVYPKWREQLLSWALNANAPAGLAFYMAGVDSSYTYNAAHNDYADLTGVVMPEHALDSVTITNGIVDAADEAYTGLTIGQTVDAIVIYAKDGAAATYLAAYIDDSSDGSVPQTFDSTSGIVRFNASGIFR